MIFALNQAISIDIWLFLNDVKWLYVVVPFQDAIISYRNVRYKIIHSFVDKNHQRA